MARPEYAGTIDMTPDNKRRLIALIGRLSGWYEWRIKPRKLTRTLRQNSFYHACVVEPFAAFLREQQFSLSSHEDAHEILKEKFLKTPVADPNGEVVGYVNRSTTSLSVQEFSDFLDLAREWLEQMFGIVTPEPELADPQPAAPRQRVGAS